MSCDDDLSVTPTSFIHEDISGYNCDPGKHLPHYRGIDERRRLRRKLGPAYRPLMGTPMGSYELNMTKPMHCLAARKVTTCFLDILGLPTCAYVSSR